MKRILSTVLVALLMMCMFSVASAEGTELTVKGTGVSYMLADKAIVVLGVSEKSNDVREAQSKVNSKMNAIYNALLGAGIDAKDIGTEYISIQTNYDYSFSVARFTGYTASNTVSIATTEIDKVGEYIDLAFDAGANTLDNISFTATDTEKAQKAALELAVKDAMNKAEIIAAATGMKISSIEEITESTNNYSTGAPSLMANFRDSAVKEMADSTLVQASTLSINSSVTIKFELE